MRLLTLLMGIILASVAYSQHSQEQTANQATTPADSIATDTLPLDSILTDSIAVDSIVVDSIATVSPAETPRPTRKLTPVDVDDNKPFRPSLHYYDSKGELLDEPVLFLSQLDTIRKKKRKHIYPDLNAVSIGLNLWDPIMAVTGQRYGGIDIWADLSIQNRFFPIIEAGVGYAHYTPKDGNFTYHGRPSFYAKVGLNYNFFFDDTDAYQLYAGIRGGFSSFTYDITDITINSPYWEETHLTEISDQHTLALYGEALLGIKVRIYKAFSMGWSIRYHHLFKCDNPANSVPHYIPGFGNRNGVLGASFSVIYTIPLNKTGEKSDKKSLDKK